MKELLEFSDRSYEKFTESMFYYYIKARCNETELITKREQLYCIY